MSKRNYGNNTPKGSFQEQLAGVFEQLIHEEQKIIDGACKDVPGYSPGFQKRSNTQPKSGYKVCVESNNSARPEKGISSVKSTFKERKMQTSQANTSTSTGSAKVDPTTLNAEAIGAAAATKIDAAQQGLEVGIAQGMAKGLEEGRRQAEEEFRKRMGEETREEVKGIFGNIWSGIKQHVANNRGKYGVALGALGAVGAEAGYAMYRERKGDQVNYMRAGEEGAVHTMGEGSQSTGQPSAEAGAAGAGRGRGR